jgi:hypothetical protein
VWRRRGDLREPRNDRSGLMGWRGGAPGNAGGRGGGGMSLRRRRSRGTVQGMRAAGDPGGVTTD